MEEYIGTLMPFGFNYPPHGWAFCDGQLLSIASNQSLFSLLGTTFGGDGQTTFGLPNLMGRSMVHCGTGPGLSTIDWGQRGGGEMVTLTTDNLPQHTHNLINGLANVFTHTDINTGSGPGINEADNGEFPFIAGGPAPNMYSEDPLNYELIGGASSYSEVSGTTANAGYSNGMYIRDPYVGIYVSICMYGVFPSRG